MLLGLAVPSNHLLQRAASCRGRPVLAMDCALAVAESRQWSLFATHAARDGRAGEGARAIGASLHGVGVSQARAD